jgi:hypothetical protein
MTDSGSYYAEYGSMPKEWSVEAAAIILCRIDNFTCALNPLQLGPGIQIRKFTEEDSANIRSAEEPRLGLFSTLGGFMGSVPDASSWVLEISPLYGDYKSVIADAQEKCQRVKSSLRLCGGGLFFLSEPSAYQSTTVGSAVGLYRLYASTSLSNLLKLLTYDVDDRIAGDLPVMFLGQNQIKDARFELALRRFNLAHERGNHDDALIDFWVGLEALFSDSNADVSFKASFRIAYFIGKDGKDKKSVFKRLRNSYKVRSKLVHGVEHPSDTFPARSAAEDALRRGLAQMIVLEKRPTTADLDNAALSGA